MNTHLTTGFYISLTDTTPHAFAYSDFFISTPRGHGDWLKPSNARIKQLSSKGYFVSSPRIFSYDKLFALAFTNFNNFKMLPTTVSREDRMAKKNK